MKLYIRKPFPVEVEQFTGDESVLQEFMKDKFLGVSDGQALVETPEGVRRVRKNDYIVKQPDDSFLAVPAFLFNDRYEEHSES